MKRFVSMLMAIILALNMFPTAALAVETDVQTDQAEVVSVENTEETGAINDDTRWSYLDDGTDPADDPNAAGYNRTSWTAADFNDSNWEIGKGPFGSAETVTNISAGTVLNGCTGTNSISTYYFRTQFTVAESDRSSIQKLVGVLESDAAAVVYLNGTKIYEYGEVGTDGYATTETGSQHSEPLVITDLDALRAGVNTVAVEVHNSGATDKDMWFHLNLAPHDGKQEQIDEFSVWSWFYERTAEGTHIDPAGDSTAEGYDRLSWTKAEYNDSSWRVGVGPFGSQSKATPYANVTPPEIAATLLTETDRKNNPPAYFFRTELYLTRETLSNLDSIEGRLCFDDAVVVYINGAKVYEGANGTKNTPITSNLQYAGGGNPVSKEFSVTDFSNLNLHVGNNTVAIELHQESAGSNDIWLDFEMDTVVGVRTAIDDDSVWSYVNAESLPEEANWTAANYDDSSWNVGKGAFSSDATLNSVASNTVLTGFGEGEDVEYYFRTQFTVPEGEKKDIKSLVGVLEYDDSATIYLNGTKIYEGKENGTDTGTQHAEVLLFDSKEVLSLLEEGTNTVAVAMGDKTQEAHDGWFHLNLAPHDGTQEKLDHTSIWTYLDNDTDPAGTPDTEGYDRTSWTKADFDDRTWSKGVAPFGYQNSHKSSVYKNVTPPEVGATELKLKNSDENNVHTYFFRTDLYIEDLETVGSLNGWISCDDAAIVYINGVKVFEWTKGTVTGNLEYAPGPAGNPSPTAFKVTDLADLNLKQGSNTVAIELHQESAKSADIWLDFTLEPSEEQVEHLSNIVMNPGPDETQMYFTWYADVEKDGYVALAKYDTLVDGKMPENAVKQTAAVQKATDGNYNYKVTAQDLEKGVKYAYQVVSGNYKSDIYSFTTGSGKTDFSFGFVADIQIVGSNNTKWADSLNKLVTNFPNQSFLLSAGDQVNTNSSEVEYDHLLDLAQMRSLPFAPVVGNHDRNKIYQEHFTQPNLSAQYGVTPGGADSYFVYNGVLFLLINAHAVGSSAEEHEAFIKQAIKETEEAGVDIKWKVVCMHSSFYSNVTDNANLGNDRHNLRTTFMPVFQELDIDVVFSGHDHIYARSYMLDGVDQIDTDASYTYDQNNVPVSVSNSDGVLYVAGSSPGNRCNAMAEKLEWVAVQGVDKRQNITNVTVTDTAFNITTYYTADMSVLDTFTIHKGVEQTDIALNMGADETEMNITWYSNAAGTGTVKLAKQSDLVGNAMPESAKTFSATGVTSSQTGYNSYQTTMTGLEPDTTYAYQLVNGEKASDIYTFTTGGAGAFSFAYVGDPQIGAGKISTDTAGWDKTLNIIEDDEKFDGVSFMLSAGDQVNTANNEEQYDGYLNHETLKSLPVATVIGNHDTKSGMANYSEHFNVANESSTQGVTDAGGDSYFVYNNTLFMVLNTNDLSTAEHKAFMESAIKATKDQDIRWKIVTFHQSIYTVASHYNNDKTTRREELVPVFDALDIDVVLQGHDHVYCRTYMMDGLEVSKNENYTYGNGDNNAPTAVTNPNGILYITANSGSGSKHYGIKTDMQFPYSAVQNQEKVPNVSKVEISEKQFTITTYRTNDMTVVDTFTINRTEEVPQKNLEGISVTTQPTKTSYKAGETFDPAGMVVTATYSDGTTAEITDYTFTPNGPLTTKDTAVTVTYEGKTASVDITVEKVLEGISVTTQPTKTSYKAGETFDPAGMVVTATYSDDTTEAVTDYTVTPNGPLTTADKTVTVTYQGKTASVNITVKKATSSGPSSPSTPTSYAVNLEDLENGSVTASSKSAAKGSTVTLTVTPDEGYELADLTVTDKNGKELTLTQKGDGVYTFTMPASKVTVSADFQEIEVPAAELPFTDVAEKDWFYEGVSFVYENGIMNGLTTTTFGPSASTTRGMVVTMLWRMEDQPQAQSGAAFADVKEGAYYAEAIDWAAENGIVNGTSDTTFAPDQAVTRQQLAAILYRYSQYKGYDVTTQGDLTAFGDWDQVSDYAVEPMEWAVGSSLIQGIDHNLVPAGSATRAQLATIFSRFITNFGS